ncbi:MAG: NTP transferase domain-containing protein [Bacteriovoracia bacterium]
MKTTTCILLAGGRASRLGVLKGLFERRGEPWILHQLRALRTAGVTHAVLGLGFGSEQYFERFPDWRTAMENWIDAEGLRLRVAINPRPEHGPFSTLKAAWAVAGSLDAAFVLPVDVPCPHPEVWRKLAGAMDGEATLVTAPYCEQTDGVTQGGHPVLLRGTLGVGTAADGSRLDVFLRALPRESVRRVRVEDQRVLQNLNTPEDFARAAL